MATPVAHEGKPATPPAGTPVEQFYLSSLEADSLDGRRGPYTFGEVVEELRMSICHQRPLGVMANCQHTGKRPQPVGCNIWLDKKVILVFDPKLYKEYKPVTHEAIARHCRPWDTDNLNDDPVYNKWMQIDGFCGFVHECLQKKPLWWKWQGRVYPVISHLLGDLFHQIQSAANERLFVVVSGQFTYESLTADEVLAQLRANIGMKSTISRVNSTMFIEFAATPITTMSPYEYLAQISKVDKQLTREQLVQLFTVTVPEIVNKSRSYQWDGKQYATIETLLVEVGRQLKNI